MWKKHINKKNIIISIAGIIGITLIILIACSLNSKNKEIGAVEIKNYIIKEDGTKVNNSKELLVTKKVGDISIENSTLISTQGTAMLTAKVVNDSVAKENLRFKIKYISDDGKVISEAVGFAGKAAPNEIKEIVSYITFDVVNAKDVVYEIMN